MNLDLPGIFLAGLLTFLSPCVLPLVPLYLSFLAGVSLSQLRSGEASKRPWVAALAFSLGLTLVFVALGMVATTVGAALAEHRVRLLQVGGIALFVLGLKQVGVIRIPWLDRESRPWLNRVQKGSSAFGAFLFGAAFALGWTPCIGPVLGAVLTYTSAATSNPAMGALYLGLYAAGISVPLIAVSFAAPIALKWLERARRHLRAFEIATGVLLAVMGVLLFTDTLGALMPKATQDSEVAASCEVGEGGSGTCALPTTIDGETSADGAASALTKIERPTMVEFVSSTCTVCQRMAPVVALAEQACAGHGVDVLRLDVGTPEGRQAATRYGIRGVPTFLFLDETGREAVRHIGEQPLATLQQGLDAIGARCAGI